MSLQNPLIANEAMYSRAKGDYFYPQTVDKQVLMKNGDRLDAYLAGMVIPNGMDLLWENVSPTSGFGPQTINLNLSSYSFVMIVFRLSAVENTNYQFTEFARVDGYKYLSSMSWDGTDYNREYYVNSDNIRFGNSNQGGNVNIPMYIYGIKENASIGGEGTLLNADMLGGVAAENYATTEYVDNKTKEKIVWENANPSSSFGAQTITFSALDTSKKHILKCILSDGNHTFVSYNELEIGKGAVPMISYKVRYVEELTTTSIKFGVSDGNVNPWQLIEVG